MGRDRASLSYPGRSVVADCGGESERVENPPGSVTQSPDLVQSFSTPSRTEDHASGEEPMKPDQTR